MSMTIQSSVKDKILATSSETSKVENAPAEMLRDLDQQMEKRADDGCTLWIKLYSKYEYEIRYHPGKANVVIEALSRKERVKPRRVRAMAMTIQYGVRGMILTAQSEAFKQENVLAEILHGLDQQMERKGDESFVCKLASLKIDVRSTYNAELLRCTTEGYVEANRSTSLHAEHFETQALSNNLLVTSKQFFGFEKEDPHAHIRYFNKITSTLKYKDVPETSIKLMLFPFSIDGPARIWLDKEPSRSILTWDDLVSKFINHFFPPSKTTNLRNEISNFQQKFEETFSEAWDRFKDLLRACPHHGFTELHQLDTFYNGLNPSDQDSLNSAAGGNLLERSAQDVLKIIENKSKVRNSRNKPIVSQVKASNVDSSEIASAVTSAMTAMFKQHQVTPAPASVKAVKESCVTCGGAHSYRQCPATDGNTFLGYQDNIQGYVSAAAVNYNQGNTGYRPQSVANQF
ncbi:reverse transcriptase domain-containing protein [Tanacetum coccineum]